MVFIFNPGDISQSKKNGQIVGNHYKNDVLGMIQKEIENKNLKKAILVEHPNNYTYAFSLKDEFKSKETIKVSIPKSVFDLNDPYIARLNLLKDIGVRIQKQNMTKAIAIGVAFTLMVGSIPYIFIKTHEKENKLNDENIHNYVDELNEQRLENDVPPLQYNYETNEIEGRSK